MLETIASNNAATPQNSGTPMGLCSGLCGARCCARPPQRTAMDFNGNGPEQQSPVLSKGPSSPGLVRGMSTRAPANEHKTQTKEQLEAESMAARHVVRSWLQFRENADAAGAAALCTPDIKLDTPRLEPIRGIQEVMKVYARPAPPCKNTTELDATQVHAGLWQVARTYTIERSGHEIALQQTWMVVFVPWPLISEVASIYATPGQFHESWN